MGKILKCSVTSRRYTSILTLKMAAARHSEIEKTVCQSRRRNIP